MRTSYNDEKIQPGQAFALQPDGKVLIGDSFTNVNGANRTTVARLTSNGSLDGSFTPVTAAGIHSLALLPDGRVLVAGAFLTVSGGLRPYLARLQGDLSNTAPLLTMVRSNTFVRVTWPVSSPAFGLQESTNATLSGAWSWVTTPAITNGAQVSTTLAPTGPQKFFRLRKP